LFSLHGAKVFAHRRQVEVELACVLQSMPVKCFNDQVFHGYTKADV